MTSSTNCPAVKPLTLPNGSRPAGRLSSLVSPGAKYTGRKPGRRAIGPVAEPLPRGSARFTTGAPNFSATCWTPRPRSCTSKLLLWPSFFFLRGRCFAVLVSCPCNFSLATRSAQSGYNLRRTIHIPRLPGRAAALLDLFYTVHNLLQHPSARHPLFWAFASLTLSPFVLFASSYVLVAFVSVGPSPAPLNSHYPPDTDTKNNQHSRAIPA